MMSLVQDMLKGDFVSLSRLITMVEDGSAGSSDVMRQIYPYSGNAYCVGITGPPGAGKSTLTGKLTGWMREKEWTVGVIACDPSSPLSGGALLGDRILGGQLDGSDSSLQGIAAFPAIAMRQ